MRRLSHLHALRVFEAAARHLHFGRAAQELHLDPTAVSHQIRNLEQALGVQLFKRRPRPLSLTEAGKQLYPEISASLDRMVRAVEAVQQTTAPPLVVSMTHAFAAEWFSPRLPAIQSALGREIEVHADNAPASLTDGSVDLALRSQEEAGSQHIWHRLLDDAYVLVGAPDLPGDGDLQSLPRIQYRWHSPKWAPLDWHQWFEDAGETFTEMPPAASFSEESHAITAAIAGVGIALVSRCLAARRIASGELEQLHAYRAPAPPIWGVYRDGHPRAEEIKLLLDTILDRAEP